MKKLSIAYFGTPFFSADFLERLITDSSMNRFIKIKFVITQPDRPVGRKQILSPTPVKITAQKYGLKCLEIENWDLIRNLKLEIKNSDLCLVYAFSQKIPQDLLVLPRLGFINIHPSLLPKYRGPSPIAYPLINGETKTGVTLMKMDEKIDHGPIIAQEEIEILPTDRRSDLEKKLTDLAFKMLKDFLTGVAEEGFPTARTQGALAGGNPKQALLQFKDQNHSQATYTKLLKKEDGFIPYEIIKILLSPKSKILNPIQIQNIKNQNPKLFMNLKLENFDLIRNWKLEIRNSSKIIINYFRGLYPWPGLWSILPNGKRLKITDIQPPITNHQPLIINRVQLEGKREVDFETFQKAYKIF